MEPFLAQLKHLCATFPTRAKWVFVPTHAIGRTLGDRLALDGTDWANLRLVTPLEVALRMGAPFLVERGIDPSEEGLGPALIMRLLLALPDDAGYFRPLASQPQMALALWSTLREIRMAGVTASDLEAEAFASPEKHAELVALLAAYEAFLASQQRADLATVFVEALRHPDWCPVRARDCWTELPDVVWPPLQRALLDAMPGERMAPAAFELPDVRRPRRLADVPTARVTPGPEAALAFLLAPGSASAPRPGSVGFFHAGGAEAEVEEVFRRVLASGASLDQVEIVCASPSYPTLVREKAVRYGWPVTIAQGIPATMTRPGRAVLSLIDWIEDAFAAGRLRRLLQSGDVHLGHLTIGPGRAARLLVRSEAAWGRDTYRLALGRLARDSRTRADRDDLPEDQREGLRTRAREADELAGWIGALIRAIPEPDAASRVELQRVVEAARTWLDDVVARTSALDAVAAASLSGAMSDLGALGSFPCSLGQALRFIRERVESLTVGADRPWPGHLHVSALRTAGFAGRPRVFVVGLEEGRVFPASFEDPILLDAERAQISPALACAGDRTDEAVHAAVARLAAMSADPGVTITLSYSCRDLREYRETYASWLVLQAWRVVSGRPAESYHDLHVHLGAPVSCVPAAADQVLGEARWWLRGVVRAGEQARPAVLARYAALGAGETARDVRRSPQFTPFDGYVPAAGPVLDFCAPGAVVSATRLEDAAACPFRHFLRYGLGVDALETGERDRDVWLNPLLRGSLLHGLYADLLRRCRTGTRRATVPDDRDWLMARGRDALETLAVEMPPPSREVRDRETALFLDDLALFLDAEARLDASHVPVGLEVPFGRGAGHDEEPLARAEPVTIESRDGSERAAWPDESIGSIGSVPRDTRSSTTRPGASGPGTGRERSPGARDCSTRSMAWRQSSCSSGATRRPASSQPSTTSRARGGSRNGSACPRHHGRRSRRSCPTSARSSRPDCSSMQPTRARASSATTVVPAAGVRQERPKPRTATTCSRPIGSW